MKNKKHLVLIFVLAILVLVSGCTKKKNSQKENKPVQSIDEDMAKVEENKIKKIMENFRVLISANKEPYEIIKFIDENIDKTTPVEATEMIKEFETVQEKYMNIYSEGLYKSNRQEILNQVFPNGEYDPQKLDAIEDGELKEIVTKIVEGRYKLINIEGSFFPIIDYGSFKKYGKYLPEDMRGYLNVKALESDSPSMTDGGLIITWDELANRLIKTEKYLIKYPEGQKNEEILRLYGEYLIKYMSGGDNTPICNAEDNKIIGDVLESYKKTIVTNKNTVTADIISKYLKLIEENEYIIDDTFNSKIVDLYNEAIDRLEEHK
ncbi:MAG: Lipoprotein [Sporanaerobacter sp.]|jgi:DNA-binding ferritin-like protein|uniref:hypothetical protein n=1 Tax=Sporanaerobacter sp. TaxID=2010183 RepID=UPI003A101433